MIWIIIFAFLLAIFMYILFAPLVFEINTKLNLYQFRCIPVFNIWLEKDNEFIHPQIKIFGFRKSLNFARSSASRRVQKRNNKRTAFKPSWPGIKSMLYSFKIKRCIVNIDTGNMPLNGQLYPIAYLLQNKTGHSFQINFTGKNEIIVEIRNTFFRMLKSYFMKT